MNHREHMRRIESLLGEISAADRILEDPWATIFMRGLSELSREAAAELQAEVQTTWDKGSYQMDLHEAPPTRITALMIALAPWLGWIMHEKHGDGPNLFSAVDTLQRVNAAYDYGVNLSKNGERP